MKEAKTLEKLRKYVGKSIWDVTLDILYELKSSVENQYTHGIEIKIGDKYYKIGYGENLECYQNIINDRHYRFLRDLEQYIRYENEIRS